MLFQSFGSLKSAECQTIKAYKLNPMKRGGGGGGDILRREGEENLFC